MRPARAASMGGSAACVHRNAPVRLTASMRSQVSCARRTSGPVSTAPALLTSACSAPPLACTSVNARATLAASVTSSSTQSCVSPSMTGNVTRTSSSAARERPASVTCQPAPASACAMAAPMPRAAPVTSTRCGVGRSASGTEALGSGPGPSSTVRVGRSIAPIASTASLRSPLRISCVIAGLLPRARAGRSPPAAAWPSDRAPARSPGGSRCGLPR